MINYNDRNYIINSIDLFMKSFSQIFQNVEYNDLKKVMIKIKFYLYNKFDSDMVMTRNLSIFLRSAKTKILKIQDDIFKKEANKVISKIETLIVTGSINSFITNFWPSLNIRYYPELKNIMEKIEFCVDNNQHEDIKKLSIYLKSAKTEINNIPSSPIKKQANKIIKTVEVLTPPLIQYYSSSRNNSMVTTNSYLQKDQEACSLIDKACSLKCVIS